MKPVGLYTKWVCRDDDGWYVVCPLARPKPKKNGAEWGQVDRKGVERTDLFNPFQFQRLFPHLKLAPGEGPRLVVITAWFAD